MKTVKIMMSQRLKQNLLCDDELSKNKHPTKYITLSISERITSLKNKNNWLL